MQDLYGSTYVADAIGVNRAAFSNYLTRYPDEVPKPVAIMHESIGRHGSSHPRYLWDDQGINEWRQWVAHRVNKRAQQLETKAQRLRKQLEDIEKRMNQS